MSTTTTFTVRLAAGAALALASVAGTASGAPITGSYTTLTSSGSQTTGTGPYTLTSTDTTFSLLRRNFNETLTFGDLTDLNVVFNSPENNALASQAPLNAGGGGGAPRLLVSIDTDGDGQSNGAIQILIGTSPSFVDTPASLNTYSGDNLLNDDAGRYDLSQLGGSPSTNYSAALAAFGDDRALRTTLVLDSFGGNDKTLEVFSIDGAFVPEPTGLAVLALGGVMLLGRRGRRHAKQLA